MSFRSWSSLACAALVASLSVACASGGDAGQYVGDDGGGSDDGGTQPTMDSGTGSDAKTGRDASGGSDATADTNQPDDDGDSSTSNDTGLAAADTGTPVVDSGMGGAPDTSTSTCNPSNCASGCCQGNNCVGGTANTACGLTGAVCSDCTQIPSATCVSGLCEAPSSNCPSTCAGCCDTNNVCHASSSAQYCFTNGATPSRQARPARTVSPKVTCSACTS